MQLDQIGICAVQCQQGIVAGYGLAECQRALGGLIPLRAALIGIGVAGGGLHGHAVFARPYLALLQGGQGQGIGCFLSAQQGQAAAFLGQGEGDLAAIAQQHCVFARLYCARGQTALFFQVVPAAQGVITQLKCRISGIIKLNIILTIKLPDGRVAAHRLADDQAFFFRSGGARANKNAKNGAGRSQRRPQQNSQLHWYRDCHRPFVHISPKIAVISSLLRLKSRCASCIISITRVP